MGCHECGAAEVGVRYGDARLCDGCFNDRVAEAAGLPRLPTPPPPLVLAGRDGREHQLRFRFLRAPTGLEVLLEETNVPPGEGYRFAVRGDRAADPEPLVEHVSAIARRELARQYLQPASHRSGWIVGDDDEVGGRFVWNDDGLTGRPYNVVVDGRTLSWEELGEALEPYEGWNLRLVIEDRVEEGRRDAAIVDIAARRLAERRVPSAEAETCRAPHPRLQSTHRPQMTTKQCLRRHPSAQQRTSETRSDPMKERPPALA